ncbi:charged multivesicular body protein 7-like [Paramacrobiotus metropolitanus]|uniref:charged multivesicular body protein 7-like n=1 Tax=Paramacrobiotus metropolitanus TaxID=2943436 RepID=UPI002445FA9E|nr:charged multivesicular body protein 7-like [Paramacrobiotus metropolitanus]
MMNQAVKQSARSLSKIESANLSEDESDMELPKLGLREPAEVPSNYLPEIWKDETRMNVLFTDFRPREVNPAAYDSKMKFWTDVVNRCVEAENLISFTASDVREKLQRKGRRPQGIAKVLEEMHREKRFVTLDEFFSTAQDSWVSWGFEMAKKPLWWSAGMVLGYKSVDAEQARFVDVEKIKAIAAEVVDRANSGILPSSAVDLPTFRALFGDLLSETAVPLVLKHLQRTKQILVTDLDQPDHATIKFLSPGSSLSPHNKRTAQGISEADRGVITLRKSLQKLESRAVTLQNRIHELDAETRSFLRDGQKAAALRVLRRKKNADKVLGQTDFAINNIGTILFRLENSETDEKVVEAYKAGLSALKKTQQDTSLEQIEGIVDEIQEAQEIQEEINQAISSPLRATLDAEDEELEKELNDLLNDGETEKLIDELEKLKVHGDELTKKGFVTPVAARNRQSETYEKLSQS